MTDHAGKGSARDPLDIHRLLVARAGCRDRLRRPAMTSTGMSDGSVTSEVARRQSDGTWLWVIDRFTVA